MSKKSRMTPLTAAEREMAADNVGLAFGLVLGRYGFADHEKPAALSAAQLGILYATKKYDPSRGKFSTYAIRWMKALIAVAIHERDEIRTPSHTWYETDRRRDDWEQAKRIRSAHRLEISDISPAVVDCNRESDAVMDVRFAIGRLPDLESKLMKLILEGRDVTSAGRALGVSQRVALRARDRAFAKLRRMLADYAEAS